MGLRLATVSFCEQMFRACRAVGEGGVGQTDEMGAPASIDISLSSPSPKRTLGNSAVISTIEKN